MTLFSLPVTFSPVYVTTASGTLSLLRSGAGTSCSAGISPGCGTSGGPGGGPSSSSDGGGAFNFGCTAFAFPGGGALKAGAFDSPLLGGHSVGALFAMIVLFGTTSSLGLLVDC